MEDNTELEKMLSEYFAKELREPKSLAEMEQMARKSLQEIGRRAFEDWLETEKKKKEEREARCECGKRTARLRQRKATLQTMLGKVNYSRGYNRCSGCGEHSYPLDKQLGLRPNAMSAELEKLAGIVGVERPFEQGSRLFEELTLISLSDQSLDKAAQAYGEEQIKREEEQIKEAYDMDNLLDLEREAKRPSRIYGAIDGGRVHIRGENGQEKGWRELKVGAWFTTKTHPPRKRDDRWSI